MDAGCPLGCTIYNTEERDPALMTKMANYELDEIHRIRQEISERFNHDARKLAEYYMALDKKYRQSGKYKFVDPPAKKLEKAAESKSEEAAD